MQETNKHDLNLWQKLAAITKEIGHIEKTGRNSHFNYAFMEHAQVVAVVRPIMDEYGLTVDFEAMDATYSDKNRVLLHMRYTVTNADKPVETFSRLWVSEAMDPQDKGINKALTAAEKNVFAKLFHISDQDLEDDANENQPATKKQPAQQQRQQPTSQPTTPPTTQPAPAAPNRTTQAPTAPQQPRAVTPPTAVAPIVSVEDDANFKVYKEKIHAAKTLTALSALGPEMRKMVVDQAVLRALGKEYSKAESVLGDKANQQAAEFIGAMK